MRILCIILIFLFIMPSYSFGYLDPGTGGMLLQFLLGGLAGLMIILKLYWNKIRSFIRRVLRLN